MRMASQGISRDFFFFNVFIFGCAEFIAVCRLSLVAGGKGYSLGVVLRLFTVVGSLC